MNLQENPAFFDDMKVTIKPSTRIDWIIWILIAR